MNDFSPKSELISRARSSVGGVAPRWSSEVVVGVLKFSRSVIDFVNSSINSRSSGASEAERGSELVSWGVNAVSLRALYLEGGALLFFFGDGRVSRSDGLILAGCASPFRYIRIRFLFPRAVDDLVSCPANFPAAWSISSALAG